MMTTQTGTKAGWDAKLGRFGAWGLGLGLGLYRGLEAVLELGEPMLAVGVVRDGGEHHQRALEPEQRGRHRAQIVGPVTQPIMGEDTTPAVDVLSNPVPNGGHDTRARGRCAK